MSDTVKKWYEMQEDKLDNCCGSDCGCHDDNISGTMEGTFIYESPDGGKTITRRPFMGDISERVVIKSPIISEGTKKQAYSILIEYPEDAILEAARILRNGK